MGYEDRRTVPEGYVDIVGYIPRKGMTEEEFEADKARYEHVQREYSAANLERRTRTGRGHWIR